MELPEKLQPDRTALLVVDVQNDYCHPDGALARKGNDVSAAETMVPRLDRLIDAARKVGTKVIFIRTTHDEWTDSVARKTLPRYSSLSLCVPGTWGAEFYGVSPAPDDHIITKHRYSAFINTTLDTVLRAIEARTLIVTGVATNVCVDCTARDGFQRDYFVVVPSDCVAAYDPQEHEHALVLLERHFSDVVTSDEILDAWQQVEEVKRKAVEL